MTACEDIVITGIGLASPAGDSVQSTWASLLAGVTIADHSRAMLTQSIEKSHRASERLVGLGYQVIREALDSAGWSSSELTDLRTAMIVGTSKGPADDWLLPIDPAFHPPTSDKEQCEFVTSVSSLASARPVSPVTSLAIDPAVPIRTRTPRRNPATQPGLHEISSALATKLNFGIGPRLTFSAACASSLHALIRAAMMLEHGDADRAIVVGTESSLHPAFIQSFQRLGVLAAPGEPCRPFDRNRSGFLIAEAAAAVCLERRPARAGEIVLDSYALGGDASHLTGTDLQAGTLRRCLSKVIAARPMDLIHAHATGTIANDPIELAAIEACLVGEVQPATEVTSPARVDRDGRPSPILYSHKGAIGHSLGASGLVAAVLNVMAHRSGAVPGNVNTIDAMTTQAGRINLGAIERAITRSIAIAAGFGGATGVVGLRTV